ncbi:MAG: tripartite tricarboxylate transporter substrate binding protein [Sphaerochaetaceae bacterium]
MKKRWISLVLILAILFSFVGQSLFAAGDAEKKAEFPTKSMEMTILFGAGAAGDVIGRKAADIAQRHLGQPIVPVNREGGGGAVGYQYVLGTKPDGYNLIWNSTSVSITHYQGNMRQPYDAFRGIANLTQEASALAINANDNRWSNFEEFVAYGKANPGKLTIANSGVGSFNQLIAAAITDIVGIQVKHIPMTGKESATALLGGKVDAMVNMSFDIIQGEQGGLMKALVLVSPNRFDLLPNTPTMKELGYDLDIMMYRGVGVPKDTPDAVVAVLEDAFVKAGNSPEFKEFVEKYGAVVDVKGAKAFDEQMGRDDALVADIMEKIGIKVL